MIIKHSTLRRCLLGCVIALVPMYAVAQVLRPTARPVVTAERERWFLEGDPLTFAGSVYFPSGPEIFFNANEMVRTGEYRGVPLYSLKTREPYAFVFVPLARGLMKPYERRRIGDIADTVGSTVPLFPLERGLETQRSDVTVQSPAPPVVQELAPPATPFDEAGASAPSDAGGRVHGPQVPAGALRTALAPAGLNAFFITYNGRRWFSSGPVVRMDPAAFSRAGDYRGFPVYVANQGHPDTVYIPVTPDPAGPLTPYSVRR